ncbi:MAG: hypothetical protein WCG93_12180 [Paludibacter sp.]
METIQIEILNPKAKKLLKDLADLKLIAIGKSINTKNEFKSLLSKLRSNSEEAPTLEEIAKEVESVRANRYANKTN